jgi:hypothetical protein
MILPRIFRTFTVFTRIAVAITSEPRSPFIDLLPVNALTYLTAYNAR